MRTIGKAHLVALILWSLGSVAWADTQFDLPPSCSAGERVQLITNASEPLAASSFYNIRFECSKRPEGSDVRVVSGYPASDIVFSTAGDYECEAECGMVTKNSCAGVKFRKLGSHVFRITVLP